MLNLLKLILTILSGINCVDMEIKHHNKELATYWFIVMLYWFLNLVQGLMK